MSPEELWEAVLAQIQFNISRANFATWFKSTSIVSKSQGRVVVSVPNNFSREWLENKYNKLILKILHSLDEQIKDVEYTVIRCPIDNTEKASFVVLPENEQLEFQELKIDGKTNLNPRYTFENFVIGPFNELAHAAAFAVAENPGVVYNPLFIYGGVGLGKTHLLQGIGNVVAKNFSQKNIKYIPSEKFISGVVSAIKNHTIDAFKKSYREIDLLIVDDIQFLAGKEKTQEEFFHIFNALYEANKQIALSSDRPPKAIPAIEERLKSRFEGGMIADIGSPDFETRVAILTEKAQEKQIEVTQKVLEYVASVVQKNVRELEGALHRLAAYQKLNQKTPDLLVAQALLKKLTVKPTKVVNFKRILQAVAEFYDLKKEDLLASSRKREIARPRQIAMYLLRKELKNSYPSIGRKFGGKDHTTVIHACTKIAGELTESTNLEEEINFIKQRVYGSLDSL